MAKHGNLMITGIGLGALYLFSASAFLSRSGATIGLVVMASAFMLDWRVWWPPLKRNKLFLLSICFLFYLSVRTGFAALEFPQLAKSHVRDFLAWVYCGFYVPAAWWFRGRTKRVLIALSLAGTGLLLHMIYRTDWSHFQRVLNGARSGLGMQIPLTGLLSATALLAIIVLGRRIRGTWRGWFGSILGWWVWLLLCTVFLEALIITQSITSWIASLIVFPPVLSVSIQRCLKQLDKGRRIPILVFASLGLAGLMILLFLNADTIKHRLSRQHHTIEAISSLDFEKIPYETSFQRRLWTYRFGIEKWLERPLFGWGTGVKATNLPGRPSRSLTHMHNIYLEILVRFGIIGALLIVAGIGLLLYSLRRARLEQIMPPDLYLLFMGTFGLLSVWGAGNYMMMSYWESYWVLCMGMAFSFTIPSGVCIID